MTLSYHLKPSNLQTFKPSQTIHQLFLDVTLDNVQNHERCFIYSEKTSISCVLTTKSVNFPLKRVALTMWLSIQ